MKFESPQANRRRRSQARRRMWKRFVTTLAVVVVFCTVYALVLPAITLSDEPICGQQVHEHTDACYRTQIRTFTCAAAGHVHDGCQDKLGNYRCGFGAVVLHSHSDLCYDKTGELICELTEQSEHIHDGNCQSVPALVCGLEETMGHTHDEACTPLLCCDQPETPGHSHGEGCYEKQQVLTCRPEETSTEPICGMEEGKAPHTHDKNCYEYLLEQVCTREAGEDHSHEEACFSRHENLICQEDTTPHTHSEQCFAPDHVHTGACYGQQDVLTCQEQEQPGHSHNDRCYRSPCMQEEAPAHTHTADCYAGEASQPCDLPQVAVHEHTDGCFDGEGQEICGFIPGVVHTHDEGCFKVILLDQPELICKLPVHVHVDACFLSPEDLPPEKSKYLCNRGAHDHGEGCYDDDQNLICTIPLHIHDISCRVPDYDPNADVETEADWEATLKDVKRTGDWPEDLLAIAKTQEGYRESKQNVTLTGDDAVKGYTRYGAWYGAPYMDWSAAFVSFCAHYAGVDILPRDGSCESYYTRLSQEGLLRTFDTYMPKPGDLVVLDTNLQDSEQTPGAIGIVAEMLANDAGELTRVKALVGDVGDKVQYLTYDVMDGSVLGFGEVPAGESRTLLCQQDHEHTDDCYGYKLYYTDDFLHAEVLVKHAGQLPDDLKLRVRRITAASDPASYGNYLSAVNRKLEDSPYYMGDVGFFAMDLYQGSEAYTLPEGATTAVDVSFTNPVFTPEAMEGAAKVETYLLTPVEGEQARNTRSAALQTDAAYQAEQVEEDTYENASGGLTGVGFESNMVSTFAVVLSNTTKTGQFWERVFSTSEIVSGGTYMIVSAEGNYALRGNESNNYTAVMIHAQKGEEDPDAAWDANPERNTRYYTITLRNGSAVDNNLYWTFTGSGSKYTVQNQASSIYLALSRIRNGWRYTEYFMHTVSAELNLSYITPENVWRISNYSDLRNAGTGAFEKRASGSNDSSGSYYSNYVTYYYTEDMLIFKLSDVTALEIPDDVLESANDSEDNIQAPDKPDYGEFIKPTGSLTGETSLSGDGVTVLGEYYSDPSTSDIESQFRQDSYEASQVIDGKVVTDKSVIYGADDYAAFSHYDPNTFSVALSTVGQEYEIDYQDMVKTPVDVVFILDVSGSMSSTKAEGGTNPDRVIDLRNAVNKAMASIFADHEANRVGISVYSSGAWEMLPLGRYTANNDQYLVTNQKDYTHSPSRLALNINFLQGAPTLKDANGKSYAGVGSTWNQGVGTYTQAGIAIGNEIFEQIGDDTTYTTIIGEGDYAREYTVTRQPVFILVSDGEPTHSTSIYNDVLKGPHYGNGLSGSTNGKGVHGYYTVLSANYYKRAVSIQYNTPALFYSIGMGIHDTEDGPLTETSNTGDNYKRAVLNPQKEIIENLTANLAKGITVDQLKGMLLNTYADSYVIVDHDFPDDWYNVPHRYEPILQPNPYTDNYSYADGAYFGDMPEEELAEIFQEIYISSLHITPYGFVLYKNSSVDMIDNIGSGMEIKGTPVLRYAGVNYHDPEVTVNGNVTKYVYQGIVEDPYIPGRKVDLSHIFVTVTTDENGDQTVEMYIADMALPTYTPELIGQQFYYEQLPVRLIYQVGLTEEAQAQVLNLSQTGGELVYYTNKFDAEHLSTSVLLPSQMNPFYYHIDGTEAPYKPHHTLKTEDTTDTADYHVDCHRELEYRDDEVLVKVVHKQGNNGKLVFRADTVSIPVEKRWEDGVNADLMNPVEVGVYKVTKTVKESGEVIYQGTLVQTLTISSSDGWKVLAENLQTPGEDWQYALAEKVPLGYTATYGADKIRITTDGQSLFAGVLVEDLEAGVVITNIPAGRLPATGGGGTLLYTMGGAGLMLAAAALLLYNSRAKRRREEPFIP